MYKRILIPMVIILFLYTIYSQNNSIQAFKSSNYHQLDDDITLMSYNIRHGLGLDYKYSIHKVESIVAENSPDILAVNELDVLNPRSILDNQPKIIADTIGYNMIYSPTINMGFKYGNALFTKYTILDWVNHTLPSGDKLTEPRNMIQATLDINNTKTDVFATHLAVNESARIKQIKYIYNILVNSNTPTILMGDFNAKLYYPEMIGITNTLNPCFNEEEYYKLIDHIFVSDEFTITSTKVIESDASDHNPVFSTVAIDTMQTNVLD